MEAGPSNAFANAFAQIPSALYSFLDSIPGLYLVHFHSSLLDRAADSGTDDAGQLLATHGENTADREADNEDQAHGEQSDEPECDAYVLLLARGAAPDGCLHLAVAAVFLGGGALAAVAVAALLRSGVVVKLAALAVTGAVAGALLTRFLGAEAGGQNAAQRCALVGLGEGGEGVDMGTGSAACEAASKASDKGFSI